jgi:predicted glycogen debranching enzyme
MISIPREICRDLNQAVTREYLVTNGRGSYASCTITGTRTRRYHGLLVGALQPPLGRTLLLAKLDEEVQVNGQSYRLGADEYPNGVVSPDGYLYLQNASVNRMVPTLCYEAASYTLTKTIWMEQGHDTTFIEYRLDPNSPPVELTLLPFCTYRDFHSETHGDATWNFKIESLDRGFRVTALADARPFRVLVVPKASFTQLGLWYWRFQLRAEAERGLPSSEDLYLPGLLRAHLEPGQSLTIVATLEPDEALDLDVTAARQRVWERQMQLMHGARDDFEEQLFLAADQFLVERPGAASPALNAPAGDGACSVIAGYHWFGDWGRDTMISLEGLTLTTGRFEVARDILLTYARFVSKGMLPNRFPDSGHDPEYNTVDATLWYFHAIDRYLTLSGDRTLLKVLFPALREIAAWHIEGTRYQIRVDPADGLLHAGEPGVQLTWMDAKVGDRVITPRIGKPVEINALWYNALRLMQGWTQQVGEPDPTYEQLANQIAEAFAKYWFAAGGYLYDVIGGPDGDDESLRPNQIFALSLRHSAVPLTQAKSILDRVSMELLTPFGLRTLAPSHPNYHGRFTGNQASRDEAYHNGTVWAWLMGAFLDAHRRVYPDDGGRRAFFEPFRAHLAEGGLGTIGECFEGDAPHRAVGAIAQAWSVAEILRAYRAVLDEEARSAAGAGTN